jgi:hypothetical protein
MHKNSPLKSYSKKLAALLAASAVLVLTMAGCSTGQTTQTTQAASQTTTVATTTAAATTEATTAVTTAETTTAAATTATTATTTAAASSVVKLYQAKIDAYLSELPTDKPGTAAPAADQTTLVTQMTQLYTAKASSKDIYTLYVQGITKLSPENADTFTAYAISGMRRNSFQDYTAIENYASQAGFMDLFYKEAERVNFKYAKLNRDPAAIKDPQIKMMVETAKAQGYYVASSEGMLYYLVDFTVFAKYRNYNTKPLAALIETLAIDTLDPIASDAAFIVDGTTLAARTWNIEKLLANYKGTRFEKYLAVRFKDHMTQLFYGVNNTPTYSYDTRKFSKEALALFKDVRSLDNTLMGKLVMDYTSLVSANSGKLDDATQTKANQILAKIDATYGLTDADQNDFGNWMSGEWQVN